MGRTRIGSLHEGPHAGTEEQHEQEGVAETECYELTTTPSTRPSATLGGRKEGQKSWV